MIATTLLALGLEAAAVPNGEFVAPSPPTTAATLVVVRVSGGVGMGSNALAAQVNIEAEYWVLPKIAFGTHAGTFTNVQVFGREDIAYGVGPTISVRSSASRSYGLLTISGGLASLRQSNKPFCLDLCWEGPCDSPTPPCPGTWEKISQAPYFGIGIGWMAHIGNVELGPLARLDAAGPSVIGTLNLALGLTD